MTRHSLKMLLIQVRYSQPGLFNEI